MVKLPVMCDAPKLAHNMPRCGQTAAIRVVRYAGEPVDVPVCSACLKALGQTQVISIAVDVLAPRERDLP